MLRRRCFASFPSIRPRRHNIIDQIPFPFLFICAILGNMLNMMYGCKVNIENPSPEA